MEITIQKTEQQTMIRIIGELDTIATTEQADELQKILDNARENMLVDCSEMEYISSAGLRFFMQLKRESEAQGGTVRLTNMNEDVADIFRMSGFNNIFEIV
ncbi:MAG: STAS domain-containing protein [Paludibacteraceae bacterium]|nr:STAS domain-containing protein [Paludibacteraceae bacterium]